MCCICVSVFSIQLERNAQLNILHRPPPLFPSGLNDPARSDPYRLLGGPVRPLGRPRQCLTKGPESSMHDKIAIIKNRPLLVLLSRKRFKMPPAVA